MKFVAFFAIALLLGGPARANFASDPTRKEDAKFTHFFLKRFDKWFSENVADPRKGLGKLETSFIDEFLLTAPAFGQKTPHGFLRTVEYGVSIDGPKLTPGPFRFILDPTTQAPLKKKILEIARAQKVTLELPAQEALVGVGFTDDPKVFELIFQNPGAHGPTWIYRRYTVGNSVATSNEVREIDVDTKTPCVGSTIFSQIDKITVAESDHFTCHTTRFEDRALTNVGREVGVKVRRGLTLTPGAIETISPKKYRLFWP